MSSDDEALKERDRIAGLTRAELISERATGFANMAIDDHDFNIEFDHAAYGITPMVMLSTYELRNDSYEDADISASDRIFPEGEKEPEGFTVSKLFGQLLTLVAEDNQRAMWKVMLRHDLDGDVILGAVLKDIKPDGFYQYINLIGPVKKEGEVPRSLCEHRQVVNGRGGFWIQRCNYPAGHVPGNHRVSIKEAGPFPTWPEAQQKRKEILGGKKEG